MMCERDDAAPDFVCRVRTRSQLRPGIWPRGWLAAVLLVASTASVATRLVAQTPSAAVQLAADERTACVHDVAAVGFTVSDMDRSIDFFANVRTFEKVSDTESSLRFYRDALGFRVAGESENHGPEQERLNAVFGAHLRITGLRVQSGPGIEFLEYLTPRDGRPMPVDERASDLFHWQTTLVTSDVEAVARRMRADGFRFVSPGAIATDGALGFDRAFLVRDPDGHVMQIVQR